MNARGVVYFVGAGPGDPKLLTLRGAELLEQADAIVYDRLVHPRVLDLARPEAERIDCGKLPGRHTMSQERIQELLVEQALCGKRVVRLKGGDPSVFGRVGEEMAFCAAHGIRYEVVPGVTSGIAAPIYAGIPLTHRDYSASFAVVTGHRRAGRCASDTDWSGLAASVDTIVCYMGVSTLSELCAQLQRYGRPADTPVAVIAWGTVERRQRTLVATLADAADKAAAFGIESPAIIVVGEVVRLRDRLRWFAGEADADAAPRFADEVSLVADDAPLIADDASRIADDASHIADDAPRT